MEASWYQMGGLSGSAAGVAVPACSWHCCNKAPPGRVEDKSPTHFENRSDGEIKFFEDKVNWMLFFIQE